MNTVAVALAFTITDAATIFPDTVVRAKIDETGKLCENSDLLDFFLQF